MADRWEQVEGPAKGSEHDWRLPVKDEQQEQTVAPGDLMIRPEDMTLQPTLPPARTGIQHGNQDWNFQNEPDNEGWYISGSVED